MVGGVIGKPEWLFNIIPAALGGMFVLGVGMFAVLIASNRKLRNPLPSPIFLPVAEGQGEGKDDGVQ
jgi:hypothetical protein